MAFEDEPRFKELWGDANHHINPVIGVLRLYVSGDKPLSNKQMNWMVEHLYAALEAIYPGEKERMKELIKELGLRD